MHTIEEFSFPEIATIMQCSTDAAGELIEIAHREMAASISGDVMIIEDEAVIAMDLEGIVGEMGHRVTGVARTEDGAIGLFRKKTPDLILSDIQLADGSSGVDAVGTIWKSNPSVPVIFITAYSERLLNGDGPEPAFLIAQEDGAWVLKSSTELRKR